MILQRLSGPVSLARDAGTGNDIEQINSLPNPPLVPLAVDDVHIRRCRLAGDAVDGQYGCFRTHDLPRLLERTHGAPALIGHDRMSTAVARLFGGSVEEFSGHCYIVPKFYWPRAHSGAEDFRVLLDAGIISEASIAFTFDKPSCSICGRDIRECEHQPGTLYGLRLCHYYYDGIDRVLEGSFVYRGAEPGTGILAEMSDLKQAIKGRKTISVRIGGRTYQAMAPLEASNPPFVPPLTGEKRSTMRRIRKLILHASGYCGDSLRQIDRRHRARGLRRVGFHYVLRESGKLERGRRLAEAGAHCLGFNTDSVGICLCGAGDATAQQKRHLRLLLRKLHRRFPRAKLFRAGQLDLWIEDPLKLNVETWKWEMMQ